MITHDVHTWAEYRWSTDDLILILKHVWPTLIYNMITHDVHTWAEYLFDGSVVTITPYLLFLHYDKIGFLQVTINNKFWSIPSWSIETKLEWNGH